MTTLSQTILKICLTQSISLGYFSSLFKITGISIFDASIWSVVNFTSHIVLSWIHLVNFSILAIYAIELSIAFMSRNFQVSSIISTKTLCQVFQLYENGNLIIADIEEDTLAFWSHHNCLDNSDAIFNTLAQYLILTSSLILGSKIQYQWYHHQLLTKKDRLYGIFLHDSFIWVNNHSIVCPAKSFKSQSITNAETVSSLDVLLEKVTLSQTVLALQNLQFGVK